MVAFMNAAQQLNMLMTDLATYRREHPTEDVTSALVNTNVDGEALTDTEVAAFFILLVVAGNETTRNAISHGLLAMTTYPEQRALWQADPAAITATRSCAGAPLSFGCGARGRPTQCSATSSSSRATR